MSDSEDGNKSDEMFGSDSSAGFRLAGVMPMSILRSSSTSSLSCSLMSPAATLVPKSVVTLFWSEAYVCRSASASSSCWNSAASAVCLLDVVGGGARLRATCFRLE